MQRTYRELVQGVGDEPRHLQPGQLLEEVDAVSGPGSQLAEAIPVLVDLAYCALLAVQVGQDFAAGVVPAHNVIVEACATVAAQQIEDILSPEASLRVAITLSHNNDKTMLIYQGVINSGRFTRVLLHTRGNNTMCYS